MKQLLQMARITAIMVTSGFRQNSKMPNIPTIYPALLRKEQQLH